MSRKITGLARLFSCALILCAMVILIPSLSYAGTVTNQTTGTPYASIQSAMTDAGTGEVLFAEGLFSENNIAWSSYDNITLMLSPDASSPATIDAGTTNRIFSVPNAVTMTIEGLTLMNGRVTGNGGAIYLQASNTNLWLNKDLFMGCHAVSNYGGVVYSPSDNTAVITATNCKFVSNGSTSSTTKYGGVASYGMWYVSNCIFYNNKIPSSGSSTYYGYGGVAYGCTWTSTNCVYQSNTARFGGVASGGSWTDTNSIYLGNSALSGSYVFNFNNSLPSPLSVRYSGLQSTAGVSGTGNFTLWDPKYISQTYTDPNFMHLYWYSPCVNTGTNEPGVPSTDGDGKHRPHNLISDMGAFESQVPMVTLFTPNGGEKFNVGDPITITWIVTDDYGLREDPKPINISYSTNLGATWHLITNESNICIYTWEAEIAGGYLISVEAVNTSNEVFSDMSDSKFFVMQPVVYISPSGSDETGTGTVEAPFSTLQRGLDGVAASGEVRVMPGTYTIATSEFVRGSMANWPNKQNITLILTPDADGNPGPATMDAQARGRLISIEAGLNLTIEGISFINGYVLANGGSINMIAANTNLWLNNVTIRNCAASGWSGGAIYCLNSINDRVYASNCVFSGNSASYGGVANLGIWKAVNCIFTGSSGWNGGLAQGGTWNVANCAFTGNSAQYGGVAKYGTWTSTNCTFAYNSAGNSGGVVEETTWESTNSIYWANSAITGEVFDYTSPTLNYCDIQKNGFGYEGGMIYGAHNISAEPYFVSTNEVDSGYLRLSSGSYCIDGGTMGSGVPNTDLAGNPRPHNSLADIGAYEFQGPSLRLSAPNGGVYDSKSSINIIWTAIDEYGFLGATPITIWYSSDEGSNWIFITNEANTGIYTWETPDIDSSKCLVSIEAVNSSPESSFDTSDGFFVLAKYRIVYVDPVNGSDSGTGTVESPFLTIQRGLDVVSAYGEVQLFSGTYDVAGDYGISWPNKTMITLKPSTESSVCTIDAKWLDRIITLEAGVDLTIEGVTLTRGYLATGSGEAIYMPYSGTNLSLINITLTNCSNESSNWWDGGAIYCADNNINIFAKNCRFIDNATKIDLTNSVPSGAVAIGGTWNAIQCLFINNRSWFGGVAYKGIWSANNCVFNENYGGGGGGVMAGDGGTVTNTQFSGVNCIFWGHTLDPGGDGTVFSYMPSPALFYSDIQPDGLSVGWTAAGSEPNFSITAHDCVVATPEFVSTFEGNYRLQLGSAGIDMGTMSGALNYDLDGNPRPYGSMSPDMGAYEFQGPYRSYPVYVSPEGSDTTGDGTLGNPYKTIQKGLNVVEAGGEVRVCGGLYKDKISDVWWYQNVIWPGKNNLTLKYASLESTSPATIDADYDGRLIKVPFTCDLSIEGLTMQNGYLTTEAGAGIYLKSNSNLWLKKDIFKDCWLENYTGELLSGGAIYSYGSNVFAEKCRFSGNWSYDNGGVAMGGNWYAVNCLFDNNDAGGYGGVLEGNYPPGGPASTMVATNCTFADNSAGYGGDVFHYYSNLTCVNCIFGGNDPDPFIDITAKTIKYSDRWPAAYMAGTGNISVEPKFVSIPGKDYHLLSTSECINAGTSEGAPPDDLDGNVRPYGTSRVDMGAYEFIPVLLKLIHNVNTGVSYETLDDAVTDASTGDTLTIDDGTLVEHHIIVDKNLTIIGSGAAVTIISGEGDGPVLIIDNATLTLESLTIKDGSAESGGAISAEGSTLNITSVNFENNHADKDGGAVYASGTIVILINDLFNRNSAGERGGGVCAINNSDVTVINCTFYSNTVATGGGIYVDSTSPLNVLNSAFWANSVGQIVAGTTVNVDYTDIQGGWSGTGNISVEPKFVSTSSPYNFNPQPTSPCVDKGTYEAGVPSDDIDKKSRPYGYGYDMGAYEFNGPSVRLIQPNGGEILRVGVLYSVMWEVSPEVDYLYVRLSTNEGLSWDTLVTEENWPHSSGIGTYEWTVDNLPSEQCLISIEVRDPVSGVWGYDTSDTTFEIWDSSANPLVVTVEAPNGGGEKVTAEAVYQLMWQVMPKAEEVYIRLSTDEGATWDIILTHESWMHTGLVTYEWTPLSGFISTECLISIEARLDGVWAYDTSNTTFEITFLSGIGTIEFNLYRNANGDVNCISTPFEGTGFDTTVDIADSIATAWGNSPDTPQNDDVIQVAIFNNYDKSTKMTTYYYYDGTWYEYDPYSAGVGQKYIVNIQPYDGRDVSITWETSGTIPTPEAVKTDLYRNANGDENWVSVPWFRGFTTTIDLADSIATAWGNSSDTPQNDDVIQVAVFDNYDKSTKMSTYYYYDGTWYEYDPYSSGKGIPHSVGIQPYDGRGISIFGWN